MIVLTRRVTEPGSCAETGTVTLAVDSRIKSRLRVTLDDGRDAGLMLARGHLLRGGELLGDADGVQYYIGNYVSREVGEAILSESGAETLRWGPPGSAWTMDYRPDRVNVRYNKARKIIEITCG